MLPAPTTLGGMIGGEPLSRRTALAVPAAVAAAAVAGCGDAAPGSPTTASAGPDEHVLQRAVASEERLRAQVRVAARRHRRLRRDLAAVDNVHGEHVAFLVRALDTAPPASEAEDPVPAADAEDAARGLARSERALARAHAEAALEARSGPFARVLAGMAAAAEQQARLLDALATPGRRRG